MLFNSIDFAFFLPIVFSIYWLLNKQKLWQQNLFLLMASYVFYAWWDWRFLGLIVFSSVLDFFVGIEIEKSTSKNKRKILLFISLITNLGLLGTFKYFNFFASSFIQAFSFMGGQIEPIRLNIVLPVGISFYTFQTLSYSIDLYRKKMKANRDIIAFLSYVSFFPQLVAGPIERAKNLLPQFLSKRHFSYENAVDGMRQILWGLFKKVVVADSCAKIVNQIFDTYQSHSGSILFVGAVLFAFQIYGDFSGYSDIAIGVARLFGFNLMRNFAFPYFSRDIAEFWRRWHISLSTWFRDYLYIPLGGSKVPKLLTVRNTAIVFLVSGLWHGANWTFLAWGALHSLYFLPLLLINKNRKNMDTVAQGKMFPSFRELLGMGLTFFLVAVAWVFFRAENITQALNYTHIMLIKNFLYHPGQLLLIPLHLFKYKASWYVLVLILIEWLQRNKQHGLAFRDINTFTHKTWRWVMYLMASFVVLWFSFESAPQEFIYFQF